MLAAPVTAITCPPLGCPHLQAIRKRPAPQLTPPTGQARPTGPPTHTTTMRWGGQDAAVSRKNFKGGKAGNWQTLAGRGRRAPTGAGLGGMEGPQDGGDGLDVWYGNEDGEGYWEEAGWGQVEGQEWQGEEGEEAGEGEEQQAGGEADGAAGRPSSATAAGAGAEAAVGQQEEEAGEEDAGAESGYETAEDEELEGPGMQAALLDLAAAQAEADGQADRAAALREQAEAAAAAAASAAADVGELGVGAAGKGVHKAHKGGKLAKGRMAKSLPGGPEGAGNALRNQDLDGLSNALGARAMPRVSRPGHEGEDQEEDGEEEGPDQATLLLDMGAALLPNEEAADFPSVLTPPATPRGGVSPLPLATALTEALEALPGAGEAEGAGEAGPDGADADALAAEMRKVGSGSGWAGPFFHVQGAAVQRCMGWTCWFHTRAL